MPRQPRLVPVILLEKPKGGMRPIGANSGFYRVWVKVRRHYAARREEQYWRPYFAATAGNSAEDTVFAQAAKAEAGKGRGE